MLVVTEQLLDAYDKARLIPRISADQPEFDVARAYDILAEIENHRREQGWRPVGWKVGFTNRTLWERYGVDRPMFARMWSKTVQMAAAGFATVDLSAMVQPRIEPEVVFKLRAPVPVTDDPQAILASVEWMAAGFEIVHCHFDGWHFTAADCTADFGLHGALVVGRPMPITPMNRGAIGAALASFSATLSCGGVEVAAGAGSNVLGNPALVLSQLVRLMNDQPAFGPLAAGEIVTTGTITDAWPISPGETWSSDYGALGVEGLTVEFVGPTVEAP